MSNHPELSNIVHNGASLIQLEQVVNLFDFEIKPRLYELTPVNYHEALDFRGPKLLLGAYNDNPAVDNGAHWISSTHGSEYYSSLNINEILRDAKKDNAPDSTFIEILKHVSFKKYPLHAKVIFN
jgi:hypothetical protein